MRNNVFFRKLQEDTTQEYYQVHYDFPRRRGEYGEYGRFRRQAMKILGGPLTQFELTQSVIGVFDEVKAKKIFNLAKDCKATRVAMCKAQTMDLYPEGNLVIH